MLTGVFYVNTKAPSFVDMLNITEEPLATLPESADASGKGSAGASDGRAALESRSFVYLRDLCG